MNEKEAIRFIKSWKQTAEAFMDESDCFFMYIYEPLQFIEDCKILIDRDDSFFDDLLMDAEYAYLSENNLLDLYPEFNFSLSRAKQVTSIWNKLSKNRNQEGFYKIPILVEPKEVEVLSTLLKFEKQKNVETTMDDLFFKFIEAYKRVNLDALKELEEESINEIVNEYGKNKLN